MAALKKDYEHNNENKKFTRMKEIHSHFSKTIRSVKWQNSRNGSLTETDDVVTFILVVSATSALKQEALRKPITKHHKIVIQCKENILNLLMIN